MKNDPSAGALVPSSPEQRHLEVSARRYSTLECMSLSLLHLRHVSQRFTALAIVRCLQWPYSEDLCSQAACNL